MPRLKGVQNTPCCIDPRYDNVEIILIDIFHNTELEIDSFPFSLILSDS